MCGIFGYVGQEGKDAVELAIEGLKLLEYRGYDSAGIAGIYQEKIEFCKEVGKVAALEKAVSDRALKLDLSIAHTRWATHGRPSKENAHPHYDHKESLALVHNGIIENYDVLRRQLQQKGIEFVTETDTEVIAKLVADLYQGDAFLALREALVYLKGAFAIALVHKDHPGEIYVAAHQCPLAIGLGKGENFLSSDANAFLDKTKEVMFLNDGELARVSAKKVEVYHVEGHRVEKNIEHLNSLSQDRSKGIYEHYLMKEIHEQPQALRHAMLGRCLEENATAIFEELKDHLENRNLHSVERILILGCGTSWHAGLVAACMLEEYARIPTQVEISSEFRYKNPIVQNGTLVIAISQSGETADTLAALRELRAKGSFTIGICNVQGSTLSREVDSCLFLRAGPEISVASTKAFSSQVVVLALFTLLMSRLRNMSREEGLTLLNALTELPDKVQEILDHSEQIEAIARNYSNFESFVYIGRNYQYPLSLEGALKLKEISYINANGYPAGELKHGPIALIDEQCPTVALTANERTRDKMVSNIMEVRARGGSVFTITDELTPELESVSDAVFVHPKTIDSLAPILSAVVTQIFAYHVAKNRGCEIDQPRNLAKSVTVE